MIRVTCLEKLPFRRLLKMDQRKSRSWKTRSRGMIARVIIGVLLMMVLVAVFVEALRWGGIALPILGR